MKWKRFKCKLFGHDVYVDHVFIATKDILNPLKYDGKYNICRRCDYKEYINDAE